jgi:hypothetical protein
MKSPKYSADRAASGGCCVSFSSFADFMVTLGLWMIMLACVAMVVAGIGECLQWWHIDMRRHWMIPHESSPKAQTNVQEHPTEEAK